MRAFIHSCVRVCVCVCGLSFRSCVHLCPLAVGGKPGGPIMTKFGTHIYVQKIWNLALCLARKGEQIGTNIRSG